MNSPWGLASVSRGSNALDGRRPRVIDNQIFVGQHLQMPVHDIQQFTGPEQKVRPARTLERFIALRESFVDQNPACGNHSHNRHEQRPVQVVGNHHTAELPTCERKRAVIFKIDLHGFQARVVQHPGNSADVPIHCKYTKAALEKQLGMPAAAARQIQHLRA